MTCTVTTVSSARLAAMSLLRNGPRPRSALIDALVASGASVNQQSASTLLIKAARDGAIVRVRLGWYGPAADVVVRGTHSERVYSVLEERPGLTAMEVARQLGHDTRAKRCRVYHALAELEALGWVRRTGGKPARWYVEEGR